MKINKVYCDMCKKEIDIAKDESYYIEITKNYTDESEDGELVFYDECYDPEGKFDLCEDCKKALLDQLKGVNKNGK